MNELGFNQPNTVILGVLAKLFDIDEQQFISYFKKKMHKLSDEMIDANIRAFRAGLNNLILDK